MKIVWAKKSQFGASLIKQTAQNNSFEDFAGVSWQNKVPPSN